MRTAILDWLNTHEIRWELCGDIANVLRTESHRGQIFIDVPYDGDSSQFQQLCQFLELPDGAPRHRGTRFSVVQLATTMQNAAHSAPGFWEENGIT